jgi:lysophospholipase L1-like esterase
MRRIGIILASVCALTLAGCSAAQRQPASAPAAAPAAAATPPTQAAPAVPATPEAPSAALVALAPESVRSNRAIVPQLNARVMNRHDSFVEIAKKGDIDLLFVGDSITDYWRDRGKAVFDQYFGSHKTANFGIGGDTTQGVLWRLQNGEGEGFKPKAIMLMIGTNNTAGNRPAEIAMGIAAIVFEMRKDFPDAKILLLGIFPRGTPGQAVRQQIAAINTIISCLHDGRHVFYLDIGDKFLSPDGSIPRDIMNDLLHPTAKGYEIWAQAVKETLDGFLKSEPVKPAESTTPAPTAAPSIPVQPTPMPGQRRGGGFGGPARPIDQPAPRTDQNSQVAHEQLLAKAKRGGIDVYFEGDSITRRWGATDYPQFLANWKENFFGWNAADFGWGADNIQNILWRLENGELDNVNPKVIVLLAGTNNVGSFPARGDDDPRITDIPKGIKAILDICQKKAPNATIIVMGITPRNDTRGEPNAIMPVINKINENIAKLADGKKIRYLDINDRLADKGGKLLDGMTVDRLHPSLKGYQVWADALKPVFTELLGPPAKEDHAPAPTGDPSAKPQPPAVP